MCIAIVDYGMGNLGSVLNMFRHIDVDARIVSDPSDVLTAERIVLPGVGAFDHGMRAIRDRGLIEPLHHMANDRQVPVLGICLGMQLVMDDSDEGGEPGFRWIPGRAVGFRFAEDERDLKVPHMGWNTISVLHPTPLLEALGDEPRFYFVHSYHAECADAANVLATTRHGYRFASVIGRDNIMGAQFHPEKSHKFGMQLLRNFAAM